MIGTKRPKGQSLAPVAGNGLLDRRVLIGRGIAFAGAMTGVGSAATGAAAEPLKDEAWSLEMGAATPALHFVATGVYNRGNNTFTASSIDVVN